MPRSTTAVAFAILRALRAVHAAGRSRSSVENSLPRSVVTTKFLSSPTSSCVARLVAWPTVSAIVSVVSGTPGLRGKSRRAVCKASCRGIWSR